ncbi:uncharacterized protein [Amphiura filiformis]|uniref:uncharacterized protein n=1 Tax=Amphiura filiformis TaxID=82378 RepID=UPI003B20FF82
MEQNALDGFNVPTKPGGWVPPAPRMVPRTQAPADSKEHPQCPGSGPIDHSQYSVYHLTGPTRHSQYSSYPATGPPPPAQAIHTQDPTVYQPDDDYPPATGQHTVVIIDGYTQQQRQEHKTQCSYFDHFHSISPLKLALPTVLSIPLKKSDYNTTACKRLCNNYRRELEIERQRAAERDPRERGKEGEGV